MENWTTDQLLTAYANAQAEFTMATTASRLEDVRKREDRAKVRMEAVKAEIDRRIEEKAE